MEPDVPTLKSGEAVTARHLNALAAAVKTRLPSGRGTGVRVRQLPWGHITNYDATAGSFSPPTFAPTVSRTREGVRVSFARGLIAGIEPTIAGLPISDKTRPTVLVKNFNARREAYVFFRMRFAADWGIESIEAVALAEPPPPAPREAHKLAVIIFADGTAWRALHSNQGHLASPRRPSGEAMHHFWSQF